MRIGDEVVKVDGISLHGMAIDEVLQVCLSFVSLTLSLARSRSRSLPLPCSLLSSRSPSFSLSRWLAGPLPLTRPHWQVLEGPAGSLVDLDLRTTMGAPKVVTVSRREVEGRGGGQGASAGALGYELRYAKRAPHTQTKGGYVKVKRRLPTRARACNTVTRWMLSRVSAPSMTSSPVASGGFPGEHHLETQYKSVLRELADKNRLIEELQARVLPQGGGGEGVGRGQGGSRAGAGDAVKLQEAVAAREAEAGRLRVEAGQQGSRIAALEEELRSLKEHAHTQFQEAKAARTALEQARVELEAAEARGKRAEDEAERLRAELKGRAAELKGVQDRSAEEVRGLRAQLEQAAAGVGKAREGAEELVRQQVWKARGTRSQ